MCAKNDTPRRNSALTLYRHLAGTYDLATAWLEPYRHRAVSELRLQTGDVVLDVGCGTGMSFPPIQAAIGPEGRLVDIEPSPEMLARARARVQTAAWTNVTLLKASVEEAAVPVEADAVLFAFTHDVVRSREALVNVLGQVRPGGRGRDRTQVGAAGAATQRDGVAGSPPIRDHLRGLRAAAVGTPAGRATTLGRGGVLGLRLCGLGAAAWIARFGSNRRVRCSYLDY